MNDEHALPHEPDRSGVSITPRIGAVVHIEFHNFSPANDALVGWLQSFLSARKEVRYVGYETFGLNQDLSEESDVEQREDSGPPGQIDAPSHISTW